MMASSNRRRSVFGPAWSPSWNSNFGQADGIWPIISTVSLVIIAKSTGRTGVRSAGASPARVLLGFAQRVTTDLGLAQLRTQSAESRLSDKCYVRVTRRLSVSCCGVALCHDLSVSGLGGGQVVARFIKSRA